jgi:hypothetical protein
LTRSLLHLHLFFRRSSLGLGGAKTAPVNLRTHNATLLTEKRFRLFSLIDVMFLRRMPSHVHHHSVFLHCVLKFIKAVQDAATEHYIISGVTPNGKVEVCDTCCYNIQF